MTALQDGLPSGGYLALYDGANTNEAFNQAQQGYNDSGAVPYHLRSPEQFAGSSRAWSWSSRAWCRCRTGGPTLTLSRSEISVLRVGRKP